MNKENEVKKKQKTHKTIQYSVVIFANTTKYTIEQQFLTNTAFAW